MLVGKGLAQVSTISLSVVRIVMVCWCSMSAQVISQCSKSGMCEVGERCRTGDQATERLKTHHKSTNYSRDQILHSFISISELHTSFTRST